MKSDGEMFSFYRKHFDTVEINATFYHFPIAEDVDLAATLRWIGKNFA